MSSVSSKNIDMEKEEKQKFIDRFEKHGEKQTDYIIVHHRNPDGKDSADFYYGLPVMKNGKLQGFKVHTFNVIYAQKDYECDRKSEAVQFDKIPYMSVDEYYDFHKASLNNESSRFLAEKMSLNHSKLAKLRNKLAAKIDAVLGTQSKKRELSKPLKKYEKIISDKVFGKVKD